MRTSILLLFSTVFSTCLFATVRTVSNNPSTLAQFGSIQAAIDASSDGDSIYVHGSPTTYAQFTLIDKRVVILGPGWAPDKNIPLLANVNGGLLRNSSAAGTPNGSEIQGLTFTGALGNQNTGSDLPVDNITVRRCQFNAALSFESIDISGVLFEGCVFYSPVNFGSSRSYSNILFQNNVFFYTVSSVTNLVNGLTNSANVRFDHNLFYSNNNNGGNSVTVFGGNCRYLNFTNNVFNQVNVGVNVSQSTYMNNITSGGNLNSANSASNNTPWAVNSNVDAGGNLANQSPQMTDQGPVDAGNNSPLLDFTITSGPANNAGADGKDLGLLYDATGSLNWANSRNSRLPRVTVMNITTPTVPAGTNLTVNVSAKTSN